MALKVDMISKGLGLMVVRFPANAWKMAHDVIEDLKESPPEGYRMTSSQVNPRGSTKGGRRCNVRMTFDRVDERIPPLATSGAKVFFEPYALEAQRGEQ